MVKAKTNRSPSKADLFGWFLWERLAAVPISDFDKPEVLKEWYEEFEQQNLAILHDHFYDKYPAFLDAFCDADETEGKY